MTKRVKKLADGGVGQFASIGQMNPQPMQRQNYGDAFGGSGGGFGGVGSSSGGGDAYSGLNQIGGGANVIGQALQRLKGDIGGGEDRMFKKGGSVKSKKSGINLKNCKVSTAEGKSKKNGNW